MCELCLPRRAVLAGGVGVAVVAAFGGFAGAGAAPVRSAPAGSAPVIVPRAQWGPHLVPTGPIPDEPDVRFLLVHHTVNANDYSAEQVVGLLEGIFGFHTGDRGWPDIAYNFLIDRFGTVYEGRTGSLAGAKAGDATGGSQGFAQLCCFIGDHSVAPPSEAAFSSMVAMLAFLGDRHGLDLAPGATATFVSRGSNRQPAGTTVTTPTVSGHRDMSSTACPGEFAYASVADGTFARLATEARSSAPAPAPAPTPTPTEAPTTEPTTTEPTPTTTTSTTSAAPPATESAAGPVVEPDGGDGGSGLVVPAAATVAVAGVAAALALRTRTRTRSP